MSQVIDPELSFNAFFCFLPIKRYKAGIIYENVNMPVLSFYFLCKRMD